MMPRTPYPEQPLIDYGRATALEAGGYFARALNAAERTEINAAYIRIICEHVAGMVNPAGSMSEGGVWLCQDTALQAFHTELRALGHLPELVSIEWTDAALRERDRLHAFGREAARSAFSAECAMPPDADDRLAPVSRAFVAVFDEAKRTAEGLGSDAPEIVQAWNTEALNAFGIEYAALHDAWASDEGGKA